VSDKETIAKIERGTVYRITVDVAMLLGMGGLLVGGTQWVERMENDIENVARTQSSILSRLSTVEKTMPTPDSIPITREAERRLDVLENYVETRDKHLDEKLDAMTAQLSAIQKKLDEK